MDVREKLVELLKRTDREAYEALKDREDYREEMLWDYFASNLIANGVTVQEWFSVKDKLPQNFVSVLGYMTDAGEFPPVRECYTVGNAFFFPALSDVHPVSHWCEMPQPPKGE